jgi:hypothetical protein
MWTKSAHRVAVKRHALPPEVVNIVGTGGALLGVVAAGAAISSALPDPSSPWLFAASYGAPAAIAFAIYWWIAQRF